MSLNCANNAINMIIYSENQSAEVYGRSFVLTVLGNCGSCGVNMEIEMEIYAYVTNGNFGKREVWMGWFVEVEEERIIFKWGYKCGTTVS